MPARQIKLQGQALPFLIRLLTLNLPQVEIPKLPLVKTELHLSFAGVIAKGAHQRHL